MFTDDYPKDLSEYKKDVSMHGGVPKQFYSISKKEFKEWEIPPWEILIYKKKLLGEGSFANVYLAKWREITVVVKIFNNFCLEEKKFLIERELDIMTKLHHPNIVQILGYIEDPFMLVLEYIPNGDLLKFNENWHWFSKKIKIAVNCLQALAYLHNRKPNSLIHRDIKPQNILITNSGVAKITDFGLSRLTNKLTYSNSNSALSQLNFEDRQDFEIDELTTSVGTERYKAPECSEDKYTHKIDIYSLGIVFYEIFEGKRYNPNEGFIWFKTSKTLKKIIIENMLDKNPENRSEAISIIKQINLYYSKYL
jgi:serine/threonine protein kinase